MLKKKKRLFKAKCDNKLHYTAYITPVTNYHMWFYSIPL